MSTGWEILIFVLGALALALLDELSRKWEDRHRPLFTKADVLFEDKYARAYPLGSGFWFELARGVRIVVTPTHLHLFRPDFFSSMRRSGVSSLNIWLPLGDIESVVRDERRLTLGFTIKWRKGGRRPGTVFIAPGDGNAFVNALVASGSVAPQGLYSVVPSLIVREA